MLDPHTGQFLELYLCLAADDSFGRKWSNNKVSHECSCPVGRRFRLMRSESTSDYRTLFALVRQTTHYVGPIQVWGSIANILAAWRDHERSTDHHAGHQLGQ